MKYVKLFEEFLYETNLLDYTKKVGWIMKENNTDDIEITRERKYNLKAKNYLYQNFYTKAQYDKDVIVPDNIPLLYYGGSKAEESEIFLKNKKINKKNLYNQKELISISGDKTIFGKTFKKYDWLPKTVYTQKEAINGDVGFPVIAKVKNGHSGLGIGKFDTAKDLKESTDKFDLFCQYIDFVKEYRIIFCRDKIILINERVPNFKEKSSIKNKKINEKIDFTYVYQDLNKVSQKFIQQVYKIIKDIRKDLSLDIWSLDVVIDKNDKMWVLETSSETGLGSIKMCEIYKAIYEDFYQQNLPDEFLENIYKKFIVTGHQNYWPKYRKEIETSDWSMDYKILTDNKYQDGYKYFFNL